MDTEYEQSLRRAVQSGLEAEEEVTVNSARASAEEELGLGAGFFKSDSVWKAKSKAIVQAAVDDFHSSPRKAKPKPIAAKAKTGAKRKSNDAPSASNKRSKRAVDPVSDSDAPELSDREVEERSKKRVKGKDEEDASEFSNSDEEEKPTTTARKVKKKIASKPQAKPAVKRKPAAKKVNDVSESGSEAEATAKLAKRKPVASKKSQDAVRSDSEDEDVPTSKTKDESELSDAPDSKDGDPQKANGIPTPEDDESDMSVLIDDPPPKKKRASNGTSKAKTNKASKPAASKKKGMDLTPDEEEIKRLQGWIVKCGVRKLWHNELKDCDTDKAKIRHLRKMLEELGMTGRYSNEKARGIMEARELAAELEAAQEYAAKWGSKDKGDGDGFDEKGSDEDEEDSKPASAAAVPRRPKGFVDFGDSGDESD